METITYSELARRVGDCVMMNNLMPELQGEYGFEVFCGDDTYCFIHDDKSDCEGSGECDYETSEIYQYYAITQSGAEYLQDKTNEVVYYCEKLDVYLWGITHFGTSWSIVDVTIKG